MGRSRFSAFERLRNPAWVGDVVRGEGDTLRPWPEAEPRRLDDCEEDDDPHRLGDRSCYAELGRGGFGVVVETQDPSMVLKLTTDRSEAQTAAAIIQNALYTPGVVHYFRAQRLGGLLRHPSLGKTFFGMRDLEAVPEGDPRGVPLYALWRSAAEKVGALELWTVQTREGVEAAHLLNRYYEIMGLALDPFTGRGRDPREQGAFGGDPYFRQSWDRAVALFEGGAIQPYVEDPDDIWQWDETDPAMLKALGATEESASMALALVYAETQLAPLFSGALGAVARSMWDLLLDGVFLADVRQDNVGWVDGRWVITEVGQALLLGTAYSEREVDSALRRGVG